MNVWLTTAQAAAHADQARQTVSAGAAHITPATIRQWDCRGHLRGYSIGKRRPKLYHLGDVAAAELATRALGLRQAGINLTASKDAEQRALELACKRQLGA
ncbi:MerR family transcriptional regulator [Streptomyces sp. NBC_01262]|uniref:MerR family transcriptional regulator n=1 Tax=Streptomyces sp. NBC_01262 TaxID=2903803 RepID=UPI002E323086|nr:MerR family transcriptional regulator [Streptomyces sp. NBC_01262]